MLDCKKIEYMRYLFQNDYPQHHELPFFLNQNEMDDPYQVLEAFFDRYHLPILRFRLQQWFNSAILDDDACVTDLSELFQEIRKLAEAASLIGKRHYEEKIQKLDQDSGN